MKTFITLIFVVLSLTARAGEVTLAWQPSLTPGVTNYILVGVQGTNTASVSVGTNLMATVSVTGITKFVSYAVKGGVRADPSNEVTVEVPLASSGMRVVIEHSMDLSRTNWRQVGFFRLLVIP